MKDRKLVVVKDSGPIPELDFVCGPILTPTKIDLKKVINMVVNGRSVYECNPCDPTAEVKLDVTNVKSDNFGTSAVTPDVKKEEVPVKEPEKVIEPVKEEVKEETPVVEVEKTKEPVEEEVKEETTEEEVVEEKKVDNKPNNYQQKQKNNKNNKNNKK